MSLNRRIITKEPLLDNKGILRRKGFATSFVFSYNREDIHANPIRLKEWDFYQFISYPYCIQATIGHVSYITSASLTLIDLRDGLHRGISSMKPGRAIKLDLDPEEPSEVIFCSSSCYMKFTHSKNQRLIEGRGKTKDGKPFSCHIDFPSPTGNEKMVIATPFTKPNEFYLNYKENYFLAKGDISIGETKYHFEKMNGLLDWGRGIWPYRHEWYLSSLSSYIEGKPFGLNLGWGFGNLANATENMLFYNEQAYKIDELLFEHDLDNPMSPWHLFDKEGIVNLSFTPFYDNYTQNKMLVVNTHCDQCFGYYEGTAIVGGKKLIIPKTVAFLEHAVNKW